MITLLDGIIGVPKPAADRLRLRGGDIKGSLRLHLPHELPYIFCEWSESIVFQDKTAYSLQEFDRLMKQADDEYVAGRAAAMAKYGTWQKWYDANGPPPANRPHNRSRFGRGQYGRLSYSHRPAVPAGSTPLRRCPSWGPRSTWGRRGMSCWPLTIRLSGSLTRRFPSSTLLVFLLFSR